MSCKPIDILNLAKAIAELNDTNETSDAYARGVISRAHYAIYHMMNALFPKSDRETQPQKGKSDKKTQRQGHHEAVIKRATDYARQAPSPSKEIAAQMATQAHKLRVARNRADYYLNQDISQRDTQDALERASLIFELCEQLQQKSSKFA